MRLIIHGIVTLIQTIRIALSVEIQWTFMDMIIMGIFQQAKDIGNAQVAVLKFLKEKYRGGCIWKS
ncbi:MAG: hypothetical protein EGR47_04320 [Clostridium sp.]|nr:hypothetical protein [Clostridium sp.]